MVQAGSDNSFLDTLPAISSVHDDQERLGPGYLLTGFLLTGWAEAQHQYLKWTGRQNPGLRWLIQVLQKFWDVAWDFWDQRNEVLHRQRGAQESALHQAIREQFALGWLHLPTTYRRWFEIPLENILAKSRRSRRAWLRQAEKLRNRSEQRESQELRRSRQLMHNWLKHD